jgi:hypothetical protein
MRPVVRLGTLSVLTALILLITVPASAQTSGPPANPSSVVVDFGYQAAYVAASAEPGSMGYWYPAGFMAAVAAPVAAHISLVGQFGWAHYTPGEAVGQLPVTWLTVTGGARWNLSPQPTKHWNIFAEGQFGWSRSSSGYRAGIGAGIMTVTTATNDILSQFGGGASVPLTHHIAIFGEGNYQHVSTTPSQHGVQLVAGLQLGGT